MPSGYYMQRDFFVEKDGQAFITELLPGRAEP